MSGKFLKGITFALVLSFPTIRINGEPSENQRPLWAQMQNAVLGDDIEAVKALIKAGINLNDPIGCGTYSPLDGAIDKGNYEMFSLLLKNGAKPDGKILLHAVSSNFSDIRIVRGLLENGVDVNYKGQANYTPLTWAAAHEDEDAIKLLLTQKGIKLDELTEDNRTPLIFAAEKGNIAIVRQLLNAGAHADVRNRDGQTALDFVHQEIEKRKKIAVLLRGDKK